MGILKDSIKVINEVVTLGGASRLEDAKNKYQESYDEYQALYTEADSYKNQIEENIESIGHEITDAKAVLEKSENILRKITHNKNSLNLSFTIDTLTKVDKFNTQFNSALAVGAGAVTGSSLAVGSWALVSILGSASTGAAISGLSGVAATNATLAWFGGGALAAGGAGMSGGVAVLGGLAAIPLVYIAAKGTHNKAKQFEEEKAKLDEAIISMKLRLQSLTKLSEVVRDKKYYTNQVCKRFISDVFLLTKVIRPHGILSLIKQKTLVLFKRDPFTEEQYEALKKLNLTITEFLITFQHNNAST